MSGSGVKMDGRATAAFVAALEQGEKVAQAARIAGVCKSTAYNRRNADAAFRAAWDEAVALSSGAWLIAAQNKRRLQKRKLRRNRFTTERREIFLNHFSMHCDSEAAALAAGVCDSTVYKTRREDPDFAEAWQCALEQGYALLEAELARQRLEALKRMKAAARGEQGADGAPGLSPGWDQKEFERGLELLKRYDRREAQRRPRARTVHRDRLRQWSFTEAMAALDKKLMALGYTVDEEREPQRPDDEEPA